LYIWIPLLAVVLIDRVSKIIVQNNINLGDSIVVIPHFFSITYILNPGAAFGILAGQTWLFIVIPILVLGAIFYFLKKVPADQRLLRVCLGMIGGGALGNLLDRLLFGRVIDFLDFKVWPYIFNFADSMIVVGGILLALVVYKMDRNRVEDKDKDKNRK